MSHLEVYNYAPIRRRLLNVQFLFLTEFSLNTRDVLFEEDVIENFDYTERSPPPFFTAGFTGKYS